MFEFGLLKWGVFEMLNASARNCKSTRSVIVNLRKIPMSTLISPGPRKVFDPQVPKRGVPPVTEGLAKLDASHHLLNRTDLPRR